MFRRDFLKAAPAVIFPSLVRAADEPLLDDLPRRCVRYFWEQSDPRTGIAHDRARADGSVYGAPWWDFRMQRESPGLQVDWFQNSAKATRAHRAFCLDLAHEFPATPRTFGALPAPPVLPAIDICLQALRAMKDRFGNRIYKRYGFVDAFNPITSWQASDVIGIDVGITLLSAENLRSGNVWKWFMANPEASRTFELTGIMG